MNRCKKYRLMLLDAAEGSLSDRQRKRLENHLDSCNHCRNEYDSLKDTLDRIHTLKSSETVPEYLDTLILQEARLQRPHHSTRPRFILFRPLPATAAATLLILIVTGVFLKQYGSVEHAVVGSMEKQPPQEQSPKGISPPPAMQDAVTRSETEPVADETVRRSSKPMNIYFYDEPASKRSPAGIQDRPGAQPAPAPDRKKAATTELQAPVPEPPETITLMDQSTAAGHTADREDRRLEGMLNEFSEEMQPSPAPEIIRYFLEPGVTAPVVIAQPLPDYPESFKSLKTMGTVTVKAIISEQGRLQNITIENSTHEALTRAVRDVLPDWSFKPGRRNGVPAAVPCSLFFRFDAR
ncbi:MAG TPA: TonB family protein [bacterium]|nr:TonB family protein [bacterium]